MGASFVSGVPTQEIALSLGSAWNTALALISFVAMRVLLAPREKWLGTL